MISLIFLAGGQGRRMGLSTPKQFLPLCGKPIALHSFDLFQKHPLISEIIVVCAREYQHFFKEQALFAKPGPRRQDSVYSGLLKSTQKIIFIHDSARPFFDPKQIPLLLDAALKNGASALGTPVTSTIKECKTSMIVEKTLNRATLWEIQTPQAVQRDLFLKAYEHVHAHHLEVSDDLSAIEAIGIHPEIIPSSPRNMKITTPFDLAFAEGLCATN